MSPINRFVAAAAILLAVGGLSIFVLSNRGGGSASTPSPTSSASPSPPASPSASPDTPGAIPAMTATFISPKHGYTVRYPVGWTAGVATIVGPWTPAASPEQAGDPFDHIDAAAGGGLRAASARIPDGAVVDDWISQFVTHSDVPACSFPRNTLEPVTIDGHAGRLRGFCADAAEIEATVVSDNRVYVFTLFRGPRQATETNERALFDALLATIRLNPAAAEVGPSATPS